MNTKFDVMNAQENNFTKSYTLWTDVYGTTATPPYERPFDDVTVLISAILIFTMFAVGVILNSVTIAVIVKYKKLRNFFVYFIFSLCLSDLLSALISPLFWYRRTVGFDDWRAPEFFCKFFWATDLMTSIVTALHIAGFGVFRLIAISHPHFFARISNRFGIVCIVTFWMISLTCGFVPYFIWFGSAVRDRTSNSPDSRWPACTINMEWYENYKQYALIAFSLFLLVPLVLVIIISVITCVKVYATTHSAISIRSVRRKRKEKQALLQLTLIVVSFLFGYIPFLGHEYWTMQENRENTQYARRFDFYFGLIWYLCLRTSECMNPVIYNLGSSKMRRYTLRFLRGLCGKSPRERSASSMAPISWPPESRKHTSTVIGISVTQAQSRDA